MRNKIILISSVVLFIALIALSAICYEKLSDKDDALLGNEYTILVSDDITVFVGDTYNLVPYLVKYDGSVENSRFQFKALSDKISVSEDGVISVNSIPDVGEDVCVEIYERNTATKTNVKVNIIGQLYNVLGITFNDMDGNKILVDGRQEMKMGEKYALNIVTEPADVEIESYCEVKCVNSAGEEKAVIDLDFNNTRVDMTATGLGEGVLRLKIIYNNFTFYETSLEFNISTTDPYLGDDILASANSTLMSQEDIQSVKTIQISEEVNELYGLSMLSSLETIILPVTTEPNVMELYGITSDYCYRIPESAFDDYISSSTWSDYIDCLIPYGNAAEETYVVYHFLKTISGMNDDYISYAKISEVLALPQYYSTGYEHAGWTDREGEIVTFEELKSMELRNGMHLYAKWVPIKYNVSYNTRVSGEYSPCREQWLYDQSGVLKTVETLWPNAQYKVGYKFAGWTTDRSEAIVAEDASTILYRKDVEVINLSSDNNATIELYDVWVPIEYSIAFDGLNGVTNVISEITAKYDKEYTLPIPIKPGYKFVSWTYSKGGSEELIGKGESIKNLTCIDGAKIELTANFEEIMYTVNLLFSGGRLADIPTYNHNQIDDGISIELKYEEEFTLPKLIKEGTTDYCWNCDENGKIYAKGNRLYRECTEEGEITLRATWTNKIYTVIFDCNGGQFEGKNRVTMTRTYNDGKSLILPSRIGYEFIGWQSSADDDLIYNSNHNGNLTETDGAIVELKAIWEIKQYELTILQGEGTQLKVKVDGVSLQPNATYIINYNSYIEVNCEVLIGYERLNCSSNGGNMPAENFTISSSASKSRYTMTLELDHRVSVSVTVGNQTYTYDNNGTYYIYNIEYQTPIHINYEAKKNYKNATVQNAVTSMPAWNVTVNIHAEDTCFAAGTRILMADGTYKAIEDVRQGDMVVSWNFVTGEMECVPVSIVWDHGRDVNEVLNLQFSDNSSVKVIAEHGFFDYDLNQFVFITKDNYSQFIGHNFVAFDKFGEYRLITLDQCYITTEYTGAYSLQSAFNDNIFAENLLTLTPEDYPGILTYFEIGENMRYDQEKMQADIEKYGLYTYEEWAEFVTYEEFMAFNGKYFKILIGKGIIKEEDIFLLLDEIRLVNSTASEE